MTSIGNSQETVKPFREEDLGESSWGQYLPLFIARRC